MRHKSGYKRLRRESSHRRAMLRNLTSSLIKEERITTTLAKAKELRRVVEKMITLGKKGSLHNRRMAARYVFGSEILSKLFTDLAGRYKERAGGYTRIVKKGPRPGDGADMAIIELLDKATKTKET
ncbi:MAG: 50S ribosomal protein L17 [Oligoflexales bacterium]